MDGRVDGGGGGSALAEEGRVASSAVREGEGGGRGRRGGGREDGRTAGWPRPATPMRGTGARAKMADWDERSERKRGGVADSAYAPTFTPPLVPGSHPVASNPSACRARATPRIGPAIPSSSPSPPPLVRPRSLFLPSSSSTPVEEFIHGSNLGRPVSAKKCTASGRHGIPRFHVPYTYTYMYMYMYIYTRFYTFPYTATQPASFFSSLLLLPPSPTSPSFEL